MATSPATLNRASVTKLDTPRDDYPDKVDDYKTIVLKYIPAEVVAFYQLFAAVIVEAHKGGSLTGWWFTGLLWAVFATGVVATPLYLVLFYGLRLRKWVQLLLSTIAFVLWAATLGEIRKLGLDYPIIASQVALGIFTLVAPAVELGYANLLKWLSGESSEEGSETPT
jgi:hypothetical protein